MANLYKTKILKNTVFNDVYIMELSFENAVLPPFITGQFAHVQIPNSKELLLRRPFSVYEINTLKNSITIAYKVVGEGTYRLSKEKPGQILDILFPLGNGFTLPLKTKKIWLVGGGIGCAPLFSAKQVYPQNEFKAFLGFRSQNQMFCLDLFMQQYETYVATENGSFGQRGFITEVLEMALHRSVPDVIFACGPKPFFKALKNTVNQFSIITLVSLERRMGCATGGCAVCVCMVNGANKRVCTDGPVFNLTEVDNIG